jgi:SAM-dependent methyltransferase
MEAGWDEQEFHDRQAARRAATFGDDRRKWWVEDDAYLDHETWLRTAWAYLEPVAGQRVLDYGCGHGMAAVVLARRGAEVFAVDLSAGYITEAHRRATLNGVVVHCVQADCEALPFASESFDRVWGHAIVHHLCVHRAAAEVARILRPGGVAVFCEPWGGNPLLEIARRYLPYPHKERTPKERPLTSGRLAPLRRHFVQVQVEGFQLLTLIRRLGWYIGTGWLERLEQKLLRRWPWLWQWCRYVVITCRKEQSPKRQFLDE